MTRPLSMNSSPKTLRMGYKQAERSVLGTELEAQSTMQVGMALKVIA